MTRARAVALLMAASTLGCAVKEVDLKDPKTWGPKKPVWVYIAPLRELSAACFSGSMPPAVIKAAAGRPSGATPLPKKFEAVDILVPEELLTGDPKEPRMPFSCNEEDGLIEHRAGRGHHGHTLIKLKKAPAEYAQFSSSGTFRIADLKGTPYPFDKSVLSLPTDEKYEHDTGPIVIDIGLLEVKKYKFTLRIRGYTIDPDLECKRGI